MKYFVTILIMVVLSSCSFQPMLKLIFHIKTPQLYQSKQEAEVELRKLLDKKDVEYQLYYRTKNYHETNDTDDVSKRIWVFDKHGYGADIDTEKYNICSQVSNRVLTVQNIPLDSLPIDSTRLIETYFNYIYDVNEIKPVFADLPPHDYYLVLDWTTFLIGPQNNNLRKLKKRVAEQNKDVLYLFVAKDLIVDSLASNDFKFPTAN
jgi:hypothetical protein